MKVAPETITAIPDRERREVNIVMGGWRITMSAEEAHMLSTSIDQALSQMGATAPSASGDPRFAIRPEPAAAEDPRAVEFSGIRNRR
jgi:hypothetical protein